MDIYEFFRLADYYADQGSFARESIKDIADWNTEGQPKQNIESAKKFFQRLADAGIETYGAEEIVPLSPGSPCDEGVVVRVERLAPRAYKAKSPIFLGHETAMLDKEVEDIESEQS